MPAPKTPDVFSYPVVVRRFCRANFHAKMAPGVKWVTESVVDGHDCGRELQSEPRVNYKRSGVRVGSGFGDVTRPSAYELHSREYRLVLEWIRRRDARTGDAVRPVPVFR